MISAAEGRWQGHNSGNISVKHIIYAHLSTRYVLPQRFLKRGVAPWVSGLLNHKVLLSLWVLCADYDLLCYKTCRRPQQIGGLEFAGPEASGFLFKSWCKSRTPCVATEVLGWHRSTPTQFSGRSPSSNDVEKILELVLEER